MLKRKSIKPFSATINIGLEIGYNQIKVDEKDIISFIQKYQDKLISTKNIHLSCSITKCKIILSGQIEKHLKIGFINYPKFQLKHSVLKTEIENLAQSLMNEFNQNRIVVEYNDETVMFEKKDEIDKRIKTNHKKMKYKVLNTTYPSTIKFPKNIDYVDSEYFTKAENNRVPLFISTQFGIFPKEYSDFKKFIGQKIALFGKSLLSGVQTDIEEYIIDDDCIKRLHMKAGFWIKI